MAVPPKTHLSVSKAEHKRFVKEADAAEKQAKHDQVGIWNKNRLADPERAIAIAVAGIEVPVQILTSRQSINLVDAHVDVSVTSDGKKGKPEAKVILEDLPVLDMEYAAGETILTVTLGVSQEQAQKFTRAKEQGIVRLVLREQKKR